MAVPRADRPIGQPSGVLLAAALLAMVACNPRAAPAPERLVVAAVRQPATSLLFVARDAGCFDAERLAVEERGFELGRDAVAVLREGGADVAVAYQTPTVQAAAEDGRIRVLTALHTSTRNTRVVARRAVASEDPSSLRGARIGLARGSNAEFFVDRFLDVGGVPRAAVTIVDLAPAASVDGLARGALDAAVLSDPWAARAEQALGAGGRVFQTDLYTEMSLLVTRADVLSSREPALRRLLRGLACGERHARARPQAALAAVQRRFPEVGGEDLRDQLARVTWGLGLDHLLLGVLRDEAEWLAAAQSLGDARRLDLARLVVRGPLEAVEPDAVMLLPSRGAP